ncbi:tail fiber assembly protein [Xenorhabdus bovienii]|uniref:tail fiber assembly protein n=1 Tax=Xenorhabdus bovienii TaxID=40576 RepID=UPI0023B34877|nr:tail fiber assembly protein [Xenorhabdus bovienii]MDE9459350.1 tail fiber assembly protein [Xenorhabdus bovienii]MDE9515544.1 tail fiber assembly protein [Xenorhabdus bovienii]
MYYYSPKKNVFYLAQLKQDYINAKKFPDDAKEVDDTIWLEFAGNMPPKGKVRIAGDDGLPAWADIPPPTSEELQQQVQNQRRNLLNEADTEILRLERIIRRKMATPDEQKRFDAWELYSIELQRLDTSTVPDINWPKKPE